VQISNFEEANIEDADLIVVSVKPQDFQYVAEIFRFN
jgi:pyrroline-5-carboxylate reductase